MIALENSSPTLSAETPGMREVRMGSRREGRHDAIEFVIIGLRAIASDIYCEVKPNLARAVRAGRQSVKASSSLTAV